MSQQQAVTEFITSLALHFHIRHESPAHEEAWLKSMYVNLKSFSPYVLRQAAEEIIRTRKVRQFPLPAECREVCIEIDKKERAQQDLPVKETDTHRFPEWAPWRIRNADMMIATQALAKEAAQSNWILQLHDFVRVNQRMPDQHEIRRLKEVATDFDEAYAQCVKGGWPQAATLEQLGAKMLEKRERLRAMALGD